MRHWLRQAILSLAAVFSIWIPLSCSTSTVLQRSDAVIRAVSQQPQSGPYPLLLSPAFGHSSLSGIPTAVGKRGSIRFQELGSDFVVHWYHFRAFTPTWAAASWLADFWSRLSSRLPDVPDDFFDDDSVQFNSGPLRLVVYNMGGGISGVPRDFIYAVANAMLQYSNRGFCGMFNARVSGRQNGLAVEAVRLWITFRIVDELEEVIGS